MTVHGGVAPLIEITGGFVGDLTVRENVRLTAGLHGMSRAEVSRRFDGIIDFAELHDSVDTPYKHLSNGMKVRLAFSVVSQLDEPILLVDEVLAVGDKAFREKCYTRIDELLADGRTLFFVSHSERDLRRFCTRGLYLDKGRLAMDAPIGEVLDRYNADYPSADAELSGLGRRRPRAAASAATWHPWRSSARRGCRGRGCSCRARCARRTSSRMSSLPNVSAVPSHEQQRLVDAERAVVVLHVRRGCA